MQKTVYENYKYSLQDTAKVYIGAKYTFAELLDQDEVAFKFRLIVERYILAEKENQLTKQGLRFKNGGK